MILKNNLIKTIFEEAKSKYSQGKGSKILFHTIYGKYNNDKESKFYTPTLNSSMEIYSLLSIFLDIVKKSIGFLIT